MPSTATSFLYSLVTMVLVGSILTFSMMQYVQPLTEVSEITRLHEVVNQLATKAEENIAIVLMDRNASSTTVTKLPLTVGNRHYWIKISNDSSGTWIEGAFGRQGENQDQSFRVYLSAKLAATGIFEGVQEFAFLHCFIDDHVPVLVLGMQG